MSSKSATIFSSVERLLQNSLTDVNVARRATNSHGLTRDKVATGLNLQTEAICMAGDEHERTAGCNAWFSAFRCRSAVAVARENGIAGNVFPYT